METKSETTTTTATKNFVKLFYIMVGIPCSGKSTWIKERIPYWTKISRDDIREDMADGKYVFDPMLEHRVSGEFNRQLDQAFESGKHIVIDNTNVRISYIINLRLHAEANGYTVVCIRMDIPFWKAMWRNIVRRIKTGKWIPYSAMLRMQNNFKRLDWKHIKSKSTVVNKNFEVL